MRAPYSVLLQAGFTMRALSPTPRWALTPPFHPYRLRRSGGLLSVALSLGSRRVDVIHRLVSMEPGLSSGRANPPAAARPSGPVLVSDREEKNQPYCATIRPRSAVPPKRGSAAAATRKKGALDRVERMDKVNHFQGLKIAFAAHPV